LPKVTVNPNRKSKHYAVQSKFQGSVRQVRGKILKVLLENPSSFSELKQQIESSHVKKALEQLINEGFIEKNGDLLQLKS
jgi:A/G-specific adenine glycosylase